MANKESSTLNNFPDTDYRSQYWETPIWEKMGEPKSSFNLIDAFCPKCHYHTAWAKAKGWVVCGWCFTSLDIEIETEQQNFESKPRIFSDPNDYSDLLSAIAVHIESIPIVDKTIDCDRVVKNFTVKHGATRWKSLNHPEMVLLHNYIKLIFDIASSLNTLEYQTKESSCDRVSKFTNYVSAQTGEIYQNWQSLPENYLLILENKIKAAIAGSKTA